MKFYFYTILTFLMLLPYHIVNAQNRILQSLQETGDFAGYNTEAQAGANLPAMVGSIIRSLLGLVGTVFMVLIVYAGVTWMTAGGNEEKITKAKKIIANSSIGLIIVIISYAAVTIIFDVIIGATNEANQPPPVNP